MDKNIDSKKYEKTIKKLKRTERAIYNVTLLATAIIMIMIFPLKISSPTGEAVIDFPGISPVIAFLLIVLCYAIEVTVYSKLITRSIWVPLADECDPEKCIALTLAVAKPRELVIFCTSAYIFFGDYKEALKYAEDAVTDRSPRYSLLARYYKAYAEFLLGDTDAFKNTVSEFSSELNNNPKLKPKLIENHRRTECVLNLLSVIADNDKEKINELINTITFEGDAKVSNVLIKYAKALAFCSLEDADNARSEFEWIKENAPKTVFATIADEKLKKI